MSRIGSAGLIFFSLAAICLGVPAEASRTAPRSQPSPSVRVAVTRTATIAAADTIDVPSTPLEVAAVGFAEAFASASEEALAELLSPGGIHLQINGSSRAGLSSRQAVASLMEFLRLYDGSQTLVSRAAPLDGSPERAFAEVFWTARAAGTSDKVALTLFLGLREDEDGWKIDEVRVLP